MGLRVVEMRQIEWDDAPRYTRLKLTGMKYCSWKGALIRSFMKNVSSLLMIPGHLTPLFNKMRRAIYDSVAGEFLISEVIGPKLLIRSIWSTVVRHSFRTKQSSSLIKQYAL